MSVHHLRPGQVARAASQQLQEARMPAPLKGIDPRMSFTGSNPSYCIYTYNLVPYEDGLRIRKGYREWQIGVTSTIPGGIHTVVPYDGVDNSLAADRLFAMSREGIWDVTVSGGTPVLKLAFADTSAEAGYGVYTHYVDGSGTDVMFYADSLNGLFTYDPITEVWAQTPGITGPITANVRFIVVHKQRIWLVEENAASAWYLPVGALAGAATEFFFGSKFPHGGSVSGLFNWSVDGGAGVDDFLVAVSRAGDVLPYQGEDPSSASTWSLRGTYFIGEVPKGPFFGSQHGGELYLLSVHGLTGMGKLLRGVDSSIGVGTGSEISTDNVASLLRDKMSTTLNLHGWAVRLLPEEGGLLVSVPQVGTKDHIQFFYNFAGDGWGLWRGVPIHAFDVWNTKTMFADENDRILAMDVTVDDALLTPPVGELNGDGISFSILTTFQALNTAGRFKQIQLIRPDFIANLAPEYTTVARYDYDITEAIKSAAPSIEGAGLWDSGLWDLAVWGSDEESGFNSIGGAWGKGRYAAVATKGKTRTKMRLIGWDVLYTVGGPTV